MFTNASAAFAGGNMGRMEYAAHVGHHISGGGPAPNPVLMIVTATPPSNPAAHFIGTGVESVRLGPGLEPAARAQSDDTKDAMDGQTMRAGSTTVLIGPDFKSLVRRKDPTTCGGEVAEGIDTILVGG